MYPNHNYKRGLLIRYLNQYLLKKDLRMKNVLINIKQRIETNRPITIRQFNSLIKFIEREKEFINSDRNEIQQFFEPLIEPIKKRINPYEHNDLLNFSTDHRLINFNVPKYLINNFDKLVKFKRIVGPQC